jgi:hypothetical protein
MRRYTSAILKMEETLGRLPPNIENAGRGSKAAIPNADLHAVAPYGTSHEKQPVNSVWAVEKAGSRGRIWSLSRTARGR